MINRHRFSNIIGRSHAIGRVFALMEQAIDSDPDLLITGETGTGKELVAREIHDHSRRRDKCLFAINCGAASSEVLLSELFGHGEGAFNDAIEDKSGVFEVAEDGTVLLDDISSLPLDVQPDLLAILKDRKVERMGENMLRDVNMRAIAISNRDMLKEVETGRFREDLYNRLSRFHIHLPPLRERLDDIPLLAEHFYRQACSQMPIASDGFAPGVMEMLQRYSWPGNVRELRNEIRQACMLVQHGKSIQRHHFSSQIYEK